MSLRKVILGLEGEDLADVRFRMGSKGKGLTDEELRNITLEKPGWNPLVNVLYGLVGEGKLPTTFDIHDLGLIIDGINCAECYIDLEGRDPVEASLVLDIWSLAKERAGFEKRLTVAHKAKELGVPYFRKDRDLEDAADFFLRPRFFSYEVAFNVREIVRFVSWVYDDTTKDLEVAGRAWTDTFENLKKDELGCGLVTKAKDFETLDQYWGALVRGVSEREFEVVRERDALFNTGSPTGSSEQIWGSNMFPLLHAPWGGHQFDKYFSMCASFAISAKDASKQVLKASKQFGYLRDKKPFLLGVVDKLRTQLYARFKEAYGTIPERL